MLTEQNRHYEAIFVLLEMLAIDRDWEKEGVKKSYDRLIEAFVELGPTDPRLTFGMVRLGVTLV